MTKSTTNKASAKANRRKSTKSKKKRQTDLKLQRQLDAISQSMAVIEFDTSGVVLAANTNFLNIFGYSIDEVLGKHHRMFVDDSYASSYEYTQFWNSLRNGQFAKGEFKRLGKQGREIWIQASYSPVNGENGEPFKVIEYASDITQQMVQREEAIKLRAVVAQSDAAIMMVDPNMEITYVNAAAQTLFSKHRSAIETQHPGFSVQDLLGNRINALLLDAKIQPGLLSDPNCLPYRTDIQLGSLTLSISVMAVFDSRNEYVGNTIEWQDVTEIRAIEQRNADYQGQIEAIDRSQAIIEFNLDGTIIRANENFLGLLGYSLAEIQGKHHRMFVSDEFAESAEYQQFWKHLNSGEFVSGEFERLRKDKSPVWIQASYNPIFDDNGNLVKVVKFASDVTAKKEMEFTIRKTQQREQENAAEQKRKATELLRAVSGFAEGDLSIAIPDLGNDAIGQIASGVRRAVSSIQNAMSQVVKVAATVATSSKQLASATDQIAGGAQEQASSLEESAASLEEITSTVKQNSDNSLKARTLSTESREIAELGGNVVGEAVSAMAAINEASQEISEIITTIDEIAFQTNLLALNAAVEAARAGEQGRGFAVVASEVRNLAQRSAEAAKEIKNLIHDSTLKVNNGTELVNKSGETLQRIISSVKEVEDRVNDISSASREQLSSIEQVNHAVSQMDRVTQSNAAQTEQLSGTSQELKSHAENLRELVARFRFSEQTIKAEKAPSNQVNPISPITDGANFQPAPLYQSSAPGDGGVEIFEMPEGFVGF